MIITDEAKVLLKQLLKAKGYDSLEIRVLQYCCGISLYFSFAKLKTDDKPFFINGISVLMESQAKVRTDTVTLAINEGKLVIQDGNHSSYCEIEER